MAVGSSSVVVCVWGVQGDGFLVGVWQYLTVCVCVCVWPPPPPTPRSSSLRSVSLVNWRLSSLCSTNSLLMYLVVRWRPTSSMNPWEEEEEEEETRRKRRKHTPEPHPHRTLIHTACHF